MPVSVEKKTVKVKAKSRSSDKEKLREIEAELIDYGDSQVGNVIISAAAATFLLKGEDRHQVISLTEDETFRTCQKKLRCEPRMAAFVGVFDGHDTDMASEYCSKGMVPHILSELTGQSVQRGSQMWNIMGPDRANAPLAFDTIDDPTHSDMEIPFIAAFQKAHERFANKMDPPTFDDLSKLGGTPIKVAPPTSLNPMQWMATSPEPQRGGTTACVMSVFTELGEDQPTVVVANTGDSRLITDDASGTHRYRQVTTDHRPSNPAEKKRLTEAVARGETTLHRSAEHRDARIFPGGLAVSRTIGDITSSKSVICTPEVVNVPLKIGIEDGMERTQRFVVATDGLWDVVENEAVGKAASRNSKNATVKRRKSSDGVSRSKSPVRRTGSVTSSAKEAKRTSPKEAAMKILQICLDAGGSRDDITICVVDVTRAL
ncbi:Protein phosphatase 2C 3 [Seminavis robusta]|uniref:Protein phosphatase 2C 3 n=1 Tax=Seminavis robusta TaxID=568900 RepID=A0A9N8HTP7_9STRA|nr:Protein phosphatase 2C 3 [Seminavis robusta]|eukprot:Sro1298_g260620.1 Protein phosphatase 2C 3 (431) ;mRNA; r:16387-18017